MRKKHILLTLLCIIIIAGSLIIGGKGDFEGADSQIEVVISDIDENFKPWFAPLWEPPSGEIESMLFALQAAIGAGFIGYYLGRKKNVKANLCTGEKQ